MTKKFKEWLLYRGPDRENTHEDAFNGGYRRALADMQTALVFMNVNADPTHLMRDYLRANRKTK